jgi:preprotein translocase subunit YajC
MFISEAFAQAAGAPGGADLIGMVAPLIAIMAVFYFFMIRPQQRKMKEHQQMLGKVTKGDTVVTNGGLVGKVVRVVDDAEIIVEVGENMKVRQLKSMLADVRSKGEPQK